MTEAAERNTSGAGLPVERSFWDAFDREIADINATLERLAKSLPPPASEAQPAPTPRVSRAKRQPRKPRQAQAPAPEPTAAAPSEATAADAPVATTPEAAPAPAPAPALPTGTDLSDPKNFGMMPPVENLEPGSLPTEDYRKRLAQDLAFANKVLHTSRVPAAVWREWRAFEKSAHERLRALSGQPG